MLDVSLGELTKVLEDNWSPTEREESEWKETFESPAATVLAATSRGVRYYYQQEI